MAGCDIHPDAKWGALSELDILKEFEKLWADELMRAAENRDAVWNNGEKSPKFLIAKDNTGRDVAVIE